MSESASGEADTATLVNDKELTECPTCGRTDFASRRGILQHHVASHGSKVRVALNCEFCDEQFQRKPSHVDSSRFCCKSCKDRWESENLSGKNSHEWKGKVKVACESCYEQFKVRQHRKDTARFCSRECRHDWLSNRTGEDNPLYDSVTKACEECGVEHTVAKNRSESARFCSHDCYYEWSREAGENHPAWKGGHYKEYGGKWKRYRKMTLERDAHTCQDCGATEYLDVHHIKPVRTFDDPSDAHYLLNLVTLCKSCHHGKWEGIPLRPDTR